METKPKRASKFIPHKFWVDGEYQENIGRYWELAEVLLKDSMKANGYTFRKKNKADFLSMWLMYLNRNEVVDVTNDDIKMIASEIFSERVIWHKKAEHKMNSRYSHTVRYSMFKQLQEWSQFKNFRNG